MRSDVSLLTRRIAISAAMVVLLLPAMARAQSVGTEKLDPVLQARSRQLAGRSRVIVQFNGEPDVRVITGNRGIAGRQLDGVGAQVADLDNTELARVAAHPKVRRVAIDRPAFGTLERSGAALGATLAREEFKVTGKGIGVAVIDSGITAWHDDLYLTRGKSPRLSQRIAHFKDFTREVSPRLWISEHASDDYGHGTHVAGIVSGNGFDSDGARSGIAPGARLVGLKVLDADGHGYVSDVIDAIDYAITIKDVYDIRVMNISVASGVFESYDTDLLAQAAKRAVDAGIVVVAAAGNLGEDENGDVRYGLITCPGNAPWVLTVGAASHEGTKPRGDDTLARFSSRGPTRFDRAVKPDLVAYGVGIESLSDPQSTFYSQYPDYLLEGTQRTRYMPYLSLSGTSMAAPEVTGTVALMLEANPELTPNAVKAILQYTAEERAGESYFAQGAGLLNAHGALRMASFFASPREGFPEPGDTIEGEWIAWSQEIVWGNNRFGGGWPMPGANAWAAGVTWGAKSTSNGREIVWGVEAGEQLIWGDSTDDQLIWGDSADEQLIWGDSDNDQLIWGDSADDQLIWGDSADDQLIWGDSADEQLIWGDSADEQLIWGDSTASQILWPAAKPVDNRRRSTSGRY